MWEQSGLWADDLQPSPARTEALGRRLQRHSSRPGTVPLKKTSSRSVCLSLQCITKWHPPPKRQLLFAIVCACESRDTSLAGCQAQQHTVFKPGNEPPGAPWWIEDLFQNRPSCAQATQSTGLFYFYFVMDVSVAWGCVLDAADGALRQAGAGGQRAPTLPRQRSY